MNTPSPVFAQAHTTQRARRCHGRLQAATQSGVGLIEVLVAVLVLSIGFLGIAALQAMSLSTNNSAMARSMATIHSYSILDAMRADKVAARGGTYTTKVSADACPDATTGTLASTQLGQWCTQLGKSLGPTANTTGEIACVDTGVNAGDTADCTVTITFDKSRAEVGGSSIQTVTTRAML